MKTCWPWLQSSRHITVDSQSLIITVQKPVTDASIGGVPVVDTYVNKYFISIFIVFEDFYPRGFPVFIICVSYHISSVIKGLSDCPEALQITVKRLVLNFRCLSQVLLQLSKLKCVSNILIRRPQLYQKANWRSHCLEAKQKYALWIINF